MTRVTNGRSLPSFLIIGAQKSGTTTLLDTLGRHPDVYAPKGEIHFFSHRWDQGIDWYAEQFARSRNRLQMVGEKSPSYMFHPLAAQRIADTLPTARLVVILRDPVKRAYSQYWHNRRLDKEPLSFAEALSAEHERVDGPRSAALYGYVQLGRYFEQLRRYADLFSADQIQIVFLEDLTRSTEMTMSAICRFVGIAHPLTALPGKANNVYVEYRSQRLRRASRALPTPVRALVFRINTREARYEPLPASIRAELADRFADSDAELASWLGRALPWRNAQS